MKTWRIRFAIEKLFLMVEWFLFHREYKIYWNNLVSDRTGICVKCGKKCKFQARMHSITAYGLCGKCYGGGTLPLCPWRGEDKIILNNKK